MSVHISLAFVKLPDGDFNGFATTVGAKMAENIAIYATPGVPLTILAAAQTGFQAALTAMAQGGTAARADKKAKRLALENLLRTQAAYVQDLPGMTEANALLSGFKTVAVGPRPAVTLITPVIRGVFNVAPTQLGVKLRRSPGATGYDFQISVEGAAPVHAGHFSSTRNIVLINLTSGSLCGVQARARAGFNQASPWCDAVNHRAT